MAVAAGHIPSAEDTEDALVGGDRTYAPGSARAALRHPVFRRMFACAFLSSIGIWTQHVVLGALAYDLTGSSTFVGLIVFAQLGPLLLFSMVGGLLADAVDRRRLLVTIAASQFVLACTLGAVVAPEQPSKVALVVVVFLIGTGQAIFNPTYSSLLPQLVGRQDLPGAVSLHSAQMNTSRVLGPVLGAFIDSAFGASAVFIACGISFLFVIGALLSVHLPAPLLDPDEPRGLRRLTAGFAVARRDTVVRRVLATIFTFSLISLSFIGQLPVVAERNLGIDERSRAYGALYACLGVGAVIGALSIGTVFSRASKARIARLALVGFSATLTAFALLRGPLLAYPVALSVGFCYFALITSLSTVLQQNLADHERGRVMALWIMAFGGTVPIGNLVAGPLIEATSVTTVMLIGALCALLLSAYTRLGGAHGAHEAIPSVEAA
jgi:MFS family permease